MPASLHSETPVKSTVAKVVAGAVSLSAAVWFVSGAVRDYQTAMTKRMDSIDSRLTSIENFMRHEAVTQKQAKDYADAFRWDNRLLNIAVPNPEAFRDKPNS